MSDLRRIILWGIRFVIFFLVATGLYVVFCGIFGHKKYMCWIGDHDWEVIDRHSSGEEWPTYYRQVCMSCGKRHDGITPYLKKFNERQFAKKEREKEAKELWERS